MKKYVLSALFAVAGLSITSKAQNIGINEDGSNPNASAILDIKAANKGLLIPRVAINNVNLASPVTSPAEGLLVYNETGTEPEGFYYWNGAMWVKLTTGSSTGPWDRTAPKTYLLNSADSVGVGTNNPNAKMHILSKSNNIPFIIQADDNQTNSNPLLRLQDDAGVALISITSDDESNIFIGNGSGVNNVPNVPATQGINNTFVGRTSGAANTTGEAQVAIGTSALLTNTTGTHNTAVGVSALRSNTTGQENVSMGLSSLRFNTTGHYNNAIGSSALRNNTTGMHNVALGSNALYSQSFSNGGTNWDSDNIAIGYEALYSTNATTTSNGYRNVAMGTWALRSNTTGYHNTAVGHYALWSNTTAIRNSAFGGYALADNTTGTQNTALGYLALGGNTTGSNNVAVGVDVLRNNTSGVFNVAVGNNSMFSNSSGQQNIAVGAYTLQQNQTGFGNVAIGTSAMQDNTTSGSNIAIGTSALTDNTTSERNIAIGVAALQFQWFDNSNTNWSGENVAIGYFSLNQTVSTSTTDGYRNTAVGNLTLDENTTGYSNTALGWGAGGANTTGIRNTSLGYAAGNTTTTGDYNTCIGYASDVDAATRANTIVIAGNGNTALTLGGSNRVRIGNTSMTSIGGQVGWTTLSDARLKSNVAEEVVGLDFILKLRPVTYHYFVDVNNAFHSALKEKGENDIPVPHERDIEKMKFSGFLAQEVEQAAKESNYDFSGVDKPEEETGAYGLRYAEFVVPMVKAMQEQQKMIEDLKKQLDEQSALIKKLESEKADK